MPVHKKVTGDRDLPRSGARGPVPPAPWSARAGACAAGGVRAWDPPTPMSPSRLLLRFWGEQGENIVCASLISAFCFAFAVSSKIGSRLCQDS